MKDRNIYISINRATHVFILCLAGLLGPMYIISGLQDESMKILLVGVLMSTYVIFHVLRSYFKKKSMLASDKAAFLWVPFTFLLFGLVLSIVITR